MCLLDKVSIRFFDDREVRAVWDDENAKWWFSVLDIIGVLRDSDDYEKNRNYWKYLKAKLKREGSQLGSVTTQFKFTAPDGKKRAANVLDYDGIIELARNFPARQANRFIEMMRCNCPAPVHLMAAMLPSGAESRLQNVTIPEKSHWTRWKNGL